MASNGGSMLNVFSNQTPAIGFHMSNDKDDKYYDIGDAFDEINLSYGAKEKTISTLKMFGKGLFNVVKFIATDGVEFVAEQTKNKAESTLRRDDLSDEQRKKCQDAYDKSSELLAKRKK